MAVRGLTHPVLTPPQAAQRIGGWLWLPVSYLILALIGATLTGAVFVLALANGSAAGVNWAASMATVLVMWAFTFWTLRLLLRRSRRFPKVFIIWLLAGVLLAIKTFAFSPVTDELALRMLFWSLLSAATMVPYIKRSRRVKNTFILP